MIAPPAPRRPAPGGGLAVLVTATVLASLAAPHATALRGLVADALPVIAAPAPPSARPASGSRPARAVAFALRQRGKPYQWGAQGPGAYDCSGLTWAAWRAARVAIPRTAAGQLAGLPRVRGRQIDMGDGTWAVCCMACRLALYRGDKRTADRVFAGHRCEPVVPLGRRRRRRPA